MTDSIGWVCPKCFKVYAPHVTECAACNATAIKQQQAINPWIPAPGVRAPDAVVVPHVAADDPARCAPSLKTTAPDIGNGLRASSLFNDTRATSVPQVI